MRLVTLKTKIKQTDAAVRPRILF